MSQSALSEIKNSLSWSSLMKFRTSTRFYLLIRFGAVAAVPVIVIALLLWFQLMPSLQSNMGIQHQGLARAVAGQIYSHLRGGERQLAALTGIIESRTAFPTQWLVQLLDSQCGKGEFFRRYTSPQKRIKPSALWVWRNPGGLYGMTCYAWIFPAAVLLAKPGRRKM